MDRSVHSSTRDKANHRSVLEDLESFIKCVGDPPSWMMLDKFVFRRDDADSFPDEKAAPMRTDFLTSLDSPFSIALIPATPPAVSRLYVQWPSSQNTPGKGRGTGLLAAHHRRILFKLTFAVKLEHDPYVRYQQDLFICKASPWPSPLQLKRLPACTEPRVVRVDGKDVAIDRWFQADTVGLLCCNQQEFAVVQLAKFEQIPGSDRMEAELCVLRSCPSGGHDGSHDDVAEGKWEVHMLPINHGKDEFDDIYYWSNNAVFTFGKCICWVDYYRGGILFYDPFRESDRISYLRLPIDDRPCYPSQCETRLEMYRRVCVTGRRGTELKFVNVARSDRMRLGPLEPGSGFTITCHTLRTTESGYMKWDKEFFITSHELWALNTPALLPLSSVLTFPLVSMDEPHLVHFLLSEPGDKMDKVSVVCINMITKTVDSIMPYIEGGEDLGSKDADMVRAKSRLLQSFLPSDFCYFLRSGSDEIPYWDLMAGGLRSSFLGDNKGHPCPSPASMDRP